MAAVGLSWKDAQRLCPKGIHPACDNAEDSVTISGLRDPVDNFVKKLQSENIFARVVNAYGYAFHCEYVHPAAAVLREKLKEIIPNPKARTEKWISSSYPESEWDSPDCKIATPEYFVHNLKSSVRFTDVMKKIPSDAIVIEIGPHFLLQSILKRGIGPGASFFGLMKRNEPDNVKFFMESIGKLYNEGLDPRIERLYPAVKFPVPRTTPMISDLIKWNHTQSFSVPKHTVKSGEFVHEARTEKADAYLLDHRIDGRPLFPATGYVFIAWEALAAKLQKPWREMPVIVQNLKIYRATIINPQAATLFHVNVMASSGHFEIVEGKSLVASGEVFECKNMVFDESPPEYKCDDYSSVSGKELYNELKMSGYEYGPVFQGLVETNMEGTGGLILWQDKWIPFLDSMLLFFGLINNNRKFYLPTGALSFKIDPNIMRNTVKLRESSETAELNNLNQNIPVTYDPSTGICRSVGVEITNLNFDPAPRRGKVEVPTLEKYSFTPYVHNFTSTDASSRLQIPRYMCTLNSVMTEIAKYLGKDVKQSLFPVEVDEDFCYEDAIEMLPAEHVLLQTFEQISSNLKDFPNKKKSTFSSYADFSGKDILNKMMVHEDSLRIMLEIISENSFRKLSALELNRSFPVILTQIIEIMQKYSHMKFKKSTFIALESTELDKEILEEHNIQSLSVDYMPSLAEEKNQDLVISSFTTGSETELHNLLQSLVSVVKSSGFILFFFKEEINPAEKFLSSICGEQFQVHSHTVLQRVLHKQNLVVLSKFSDEFGGSLYLLRVASPVVPQIILSITEGSYGWVDDLKRAVADKESGTIWLVAQDSPINGIIGLVNCLKQEPGGEKVRCVFISQKGTEAKLPPFSLEHPLYKHLQAKNLMMNVWREGLWGSFRHILIPETKAPRKVEHSYIRCRKYGDLSSFEWIESQIKCLNPKHEQLVHIYYCALNFRDVMLATGKLSVGTVKDVTQEDDSVLGIEFCGRCPSGKRVCGFVKSRGMATSTYVDPIYCIDVPDNWTLEEASTVPVVYSTCYYALLMRARLRQGESILIHSGTGGVGMAAINIALSLNCEIFTTVGNEAKRKYLKQKFPQLKDENIGCSRNTSFKNMVLKRTNGNGVDVVLNSLADDKFQASIQCVGRNGRFVEIGKYDLALDRQIGSKIFLQNIEFHGVFIDRLFERSSNNKACITEIVNLVKEGIKSGVVKPLDRKVFGRNQVEEAFRYMGKGVHVGKVVLKIRDEETERLAVPKTLMLPAVPNTYFHQSKVYIVIGGIGGFGIELTKWMISRGAKNVILTSRYGERTPYHYLCLKRWNGDGINVHVSTLNVAVRSEAEQLLQEASRTGPVGGIFNSAVVLKDAFMDCQTPENYKEVCAPKATATKYLDELSRKLCPSLDYFICFSSISCGRGNAGQTNYGYANSVMERICEERRRVGLHGLAIQWGIIGEVGVVHRHMGDDAMIAGVMAQSVRSCMDTMDAFCQQNCPVVTSYVTAAATKKSTQGDTLTQIVKIIGMNDISEISTTRSFGEMGIDSMVGVEIKQMIETYCDISVSMQEITEMKIGDVRDWFAKADAEKTSSQASPLLATTLVNIPTSLVHTDPLVVLNKDSPGTPIFIVNIGDTDVKDFLPLSKIINRPVYALVWTQSAPSTDVKSLASWYLKIILNAENGPFHLIGHGMGGNVAFEMALQNQKSDKNLKTLTILNGSEDLSFALNKEEAEVQDPEVMTLCRFVQQFASGASSRLEEQLLKTIGLEQRIKTVLNFLTSSSTQTVNKNEVADAISTYIQKLTLIHSYTPQDKLSKDINLIEDPSVVLANDVTQLKELLEQVCSGKVTIQRVFSYRELMDKEGAEHLSMVLQAII